MALWWARRACSASEIFETVFITVTPFPLFVGPIPANTLAYVLVRRRQVDAPNSAEQN